MSIYYVSQDSGSDLYNSTQAQNSATPWQTLSHAFYVAGNTTRGVTYGNGIIINDSATYTVTNGTAGTDNTSNQIEATSSFLPRQFIIKAGTGHSPILDGGHVANFAIETYIDWVIEGITFRKFGSIVASHNAIQEISSRKAGTVRDCTIHSISGSGIKLTDNGTLVERCLIYDIAQSGIYGFDQFTIQNNVIYDCHSYAIWGGTGNDYANTVVQHNTIHNCPASGSSHAARQNAIYTRNAQFNIITDASCTISGLNAAGNHSYNCVSGSYDHKGVDTPVNIYGGAGTGDLDGTDPLFTGKASNTFTLSVDSPCIGAANGSSSPKDFVSGSRDWEYAHKILGINSAPTHDMGAYEITHTKVITLDTQMIQKVIGIS